MMVGDAAVQQKRKMLRDPAAIINALKAHSYGLPSPLPLKEVLTFAAAHMSNDESVLAL